VLSPCFLGDVEPGARSAACPDIDPERKARVDSLNTQFTRLVISRCDPVTKRRERPGSSTERMGSCTESDIFEVVLADSAEATTSSTPLSLYADFTVNETLWFLCFRRHLGPSTQNAHGRRVRRPQAGWCEMHGFEAGNVREPLHPAIRGILVLCP
jgi:hypothetical protein